MYPKLKLEAEYRSGHRLVGRFVRSRTPSASFIFAESLRSLAKEAPAPVEISGDTDLGQDDSVMMRGNKRRNMKTRLERRILKEKSFAFCFASMRDLNF